MSSAQRACMPQYNYLSQFQEMSRFDGKMDKAPVALTKVVTDQYFREAGSAKDKEQKAGLLKARTLAWSLAFFLPREAGRPAAYFRELDKLPRDLEFDGDVLLGAFARRFDLTDARNPARRTSPSSPVLPRSGKATSRISPMR